MPCCHTSHHRGRKALCREPAAVHRRDRTRSAGPQRGPGEDCRRRRLPFGFVGDQWFAGPALPIVLGHEGSGEIVEIGSAITDLKEGDHTVFQFSAACGRCVRCLEGRPQNCFTAATQGGKGELMGGGSRIRDADGNTIGHHSGISCMAEYAVMDRGSIIVVDKSVPLADAALFGCAVMTGAGAVINTARVRSGDKVAVLGLGGVGLNGVMGAKLAGAAEIIAIDTDARKLELAKELGATHVINGTDNDVIEQVKDLTGGGVDFAVELAGTIPAMETAYAIIARGGAVVTAGLSPAGAQFSFEHADLVSNEKSVLGTIWEVACRFATFHASSMHSKGATCPSTGSSTGTSVLMS